MNYLYLAYAFSKCLVRVRVMPYLVQVLREYLTKVTDIVRLFLLVVWSLPLNYVSILSICL